MAALRGHDHQVVAVRHVGQRARPARAALGADVVEEEHRGYTGNAVADHAPGRPVGQRVALHRAPDQRPRAVGDVQISPREHCVTLKSVTPAADATPLPLRHPPARRGQALRRRHRGRRPRPRRAGRAPASGLLGPNGAGKSTTMKMLTAQAIADAGRDRGARVLSCPDESKQARAECGVVPQLDNLDTTLTVEENLIVFSHLYRVPRAERQAAVERARGDRPAGRPPRRQGGRALGRHAPAAADRPRAGAPAAAAAARRAHRRPGPAGAPGAVGADRAAAQRGHLDPDVHALHRGGRAAGRHRDDHVRTAGPWPPGRRPT